jgi:hypothetical protein
MALLSISCPRCYDEVVPPLVAAGYRTIVPYLRGCGPTHVNSLVPCRIVRVRLRPHDRCIFRNRFGTGGQCLPHILRIRELRDASTWPYGGCHQNSHSRQHQRSTLVIIIFR